jgi:hypothetical protein
MRRNRLSRPVPRLQNHSAESDKLTSPRNAHPMRTGNLEVGRSVALWRKRLAKLHAIETTPLIGLGRILVRFLPIAIRYVDLRNGGGGGGGEWGVGSGGWGVGIGGWGVGIGEWGVGSGEWRVESGEWVVGSGEWGGVGGVMDGVGACVRGAIPSPLGWARQTAGPLALTASTPLSERRTGSPSYEERRRTGKSVVRGKATAM